MIITNEEMAIDYARTECCNSCTNSCKKKNECKMFCNVRNAVLFGLAEGRNGWIDFSKFDHADDTFKHFLFKLENGKVYCGYMTEGVADGDCWFGIKYFKDNTLKSEDDWGFITSIEGSKITHFMKIENLGE